MEVSRTLGYNFEVEKMNFDEALRNFAEITAEKSEISLDETLIIFNVGPKWRCAYCIFDFVSRSLLNFVLIGQRKCRTSMENL